VHDDVERTHPGELGPFHSRGLSYLMAHVRLRRDHDSPPRFDRPLPAIARGPAISNVSSTSVVVAHRIHPGHPEEDSPAAAVEADHTRPAAVAVHIRPAAVAVHIRPVAGRRSPAVEGLGRSHPGAGHTRRQAVHHHSPVVEELGHSHHPAAVVGAPS
jgi:hypothetical protein